MYQLDSLLQQMVARHASDLFVGVGRGPAMRVDGETQPLDSSPVSQETLDAFMASVARPEQVAAFRETGDLDLGFTHPTLGRFRVNFHLQRGLLSAVIREVPSGRLSFEELGLPEAVRVLAEKPRGLVLVTGATGSGKSTTLAAMVHHINQHFRRHIITIEDPIEFVHEDAKSRITQREVGSDTKNFASALRHVVRESPDVILIGEMRDMESMNVAISAAMTGHLVLSSLHTLDATQTLQRILSYYPEHLQQQVSTDLALSLQGIIAQRLVPRADGKGRVAAVEVLMATPPVRKLIREQRVEELPDLMTEGEGMQTLTQALVSLYRNKVITLETGIAYSSHPEELRLAAQGLERGVTSYGGLHEQLPALGKVDMRTLIAVATKYQASDIHLGAAAPPMFRIDGKLNPLGKDPLTPSDVRRLLFSMLTPSQRERFELERELDFALSLTGKHRLRVNARYQRGTVAVALRLIPDRVPDVETLGLPGIVADLALRQQGLVLVTGPTGSGKSTTLAAMIDIINSKRNCHIITIEDPIEFVHYNKTAIIEQREVGTDTRSFAAALKYILRQDPDVILVGEMRDQETIAAALTAAETGHLVLATIHTNDAPQTADRIVDVFPPYQQTQIRVQLAASLLAILSQRLLRRADGKGRVPALEIMVATPAIRTHIREGKSHQMRSTIEASQRDGMISLDKALSDLVKNGTVTLEEAVKHVQNPTQLRGIDVRYANKRL